MKVRIKHLSAQLFTLLFAASFLLIAPTNNASAQDRPAFTQQELDQMLAPIALYPDALLAQIVMAATYPLEVVEAERWSVANPGLRGTRAVQAVERNNWDPSVKSLVAFPQILRMMSDKLEWTERLGDAFLGQGQQVMDTVQGLRHRAYAAGSLRSNDQARVLLAGDYITIEQEYPELAYEPYYDPSVVYGSWWWPQYPPVYWAPWPGYRERAGFGAGIAWGVGIALGAEFFYGAFDWHQHRINTANVNNSYYRRDATVANGALRTWQHDPVHRRGAPYREAAVGAKFNPSGASPRARTDFRGHLPAASEKRGEQGNHPEARSEPGKPSETRAVPPPAVVMPGNRPGPRGGEDVKGAEAHKLQQAVTATPADHPNTRTGPGSRPEERGSPQSFGLPPDVRARPDAGSSRVNVPEPSRSTTSAAPGRASPPFAAGRSAVVPVEQRPHVLEDVGKAAEARDASARGRASRQATTPDIRPVQAARPIANHSAPRPPERAAAPAPAPQVAAPPHAADVKRPPEKAHEGRDKKPEGK